MRLARELLSISHLAQCRQKVGPTYRIRLCCVGRPAAGIAAKPMFLARIYEAFLIEFCRRKEIGAPTTAKTALTDPWHCTRRNPQSARDRAREVLGQNTRFISAAASWLLHVHTPIALMIGEWVLRRVHQCSCILQRQFAKNRVDSNIIVSLDSLAHLVVPPVDMPQRSTTTEWIVRSSFKRLTPYLEHASRPEVSIVEAGIKTNKEL